MKSDLSNLAVSGGYDNTRGGKKCDLMLSDERET